MRSFFLHIAVILLSASSLAQSLNTELNKQDIQIGEPVILTFTIQSSKAFDSIAYIPQTSEFDAKNSSSADISSITTLYELEIMQLFKDTSYTKDEVYIWEGQYKVTGWDSAYVVIPPERIIIDDSVMYFPAKLLEVGMPAADPSKSINDINESFTEIEEPTGLLEFLKTNWPWMGLSLVLVVILLFLFRKGKERAEKQLPLRVRTLKEIDELEKSKTYEQNLKEYYFDLSIIVRKFFSTHFAERMMDKTSREIEELLAKKGLKSSTVEVVRRILTQSDLVKFAKSEPPISDVFVITNDARRVVNEIASLEINE